MAMAEKPTIVTGEDGYFLRYAGEESEVVPYDAPLEVELGGQMWLCCVGLPAGKNESDDTESVLPHWLYKVEPLEDSDLEFEDQDDDQDDDDQDDDDDDLDDDEGDDGVLPLGDPEELTAQ